jgi:ABC-type antimicrobial peptide transport system permease subunit
VGGGEVVTATVTQQVTYQTPEQFAPSVSNQPGHFILAYVAIAAILATVIMVIVGLVVYSRRTATYYPARQQPF